MTSCYWGAGWVALKIVSSTLALVLAGGMLGCKEGNSGAEDGAEVAVRRAQLTRTHMVPRISAEDANFFLITY